MWTLTQTWDVLLSHRNLRLELRLILKIWCKTAIEVFVPQFKWIYVESLIKLKIAPQLPKWGTVLHLGEKIEQSRTVNYLKSWIIILITNTYELFYAYTLLFVYIKKRIMLCLMMSFYTKHSIFMKWINEFSEVYYVLLTMLT